MKLGRTDSKVGSSKLKIEVLNDTSSTLQTSVLQICYNCFEFAFHFLARILSTRIKQIILNDIYVY